jgi:hypothetical protein
LSPTSTAADFVKIDELSLVIVKTINAGTEALKKGEVISLIDAIGIQGPASNLAVVTSNSVDGLIDRKDILLKGNQKDNVLKQFKAIKDATLAFNEELHKKLPALVLDISKTAEAQPLEAMDRGIKAFS